MRDLAQEIWALGVAMNRNLQAEADARIVSKMEPEFEESDS